MTKAKLEKLLKLKLNPKEFDIEGKQYTGWSAKLDDYTKHEHILFANWRALHSENIRAFYGVPAERARSMDTTAFYVIPELPTLDIISFAQTGTHNQDEDHWKAVKRVLKGIYNKNKFDIQFADTAGLQAILLQPVNAAQATFIAQEIFKVNVESFEVMEEDPAGFIERNGRFNLWWD